MSSVSKGGRCVLKDHFDVISNLYNIFTESVELTGLLGTTPSDLDVCDTKIRRSFSDVTKIDPMELPYLDVGFIESNGHTANYKVNREVIEINVYAVNFNEAGLIYKAIHKLFNDNFESMQTINAAQRSLPVGGVYCFSFRVKSFVSS